MDGQDESFRPALWSVPPPLLLLLSVTLDSRMIIRFTFECVSHRFHSLAGADQPFYYVLPDARGVSGSESRYGWQ